MPERLLHSRSSQRQELDMSALEASLERGLPRLTPRDAVGDPVRHRPRLCLVELPPIQPVTFLRLFGRVSANEARGYTVVHSP